MADTKWSQFPSVTPGNSDEVVGLHSGDNARFSIANIVAAVRNGLANIFVPKTDVGAANGVASLDNTGKVPTSQLPSSTGPEPATATPLMDGTGAVGTSLKYAREDHEHPADTNKQAKITASGILKGDGQGGVTAATAGTDYATPAQLGYPETGTTASRNYSAGEYICWNGLTYTADTNIALGATLSASGGNKNLTECVGGGFNKLKSELDYEDISQYFYIQQHGSQDRCSISKLVARKYNDGRVTIYATGTILVTLTSTQWTIMRIRSQAGVSPSTYVAGTATYNLLPCFSRIDNSAEPYVELAHSGTSPGKPFELFIEYWI